MRDFENLKSGGKPVLVVIIQIPFSLPIVTATSAPYKASNPIDIAVIMMDVFRSITEFVIYN